MLSRWSEVTSRHFETRDERGQCEESENATRSRRRVECTVEDRRRDELQVIHRLKDVDTGKTICWASANKANWLAECLASVEWPDQLN